MLRVPSIPRPEVPVGDGEEDNVEIRKVGTPRTFDFKAKDHVELMTLHRMVDWDGPRKFAGGRSYALMGMGALLELAVTRLAVDTLVERGLTIGDPAGHGEGARDARAPASSRSAARRPTRSPPTSSSSSARARCRSSRCTATRRSTPRSCPIRYAGISNCFRREAGAYGKDTKGLYRVHQFTKVEQVVFCVPDEEVAEKEHYQLLGNAEAILEKLEIPYRVAIACTGEIGLGQTRKHEVESWMPGRNDGKGAYNETHSCSTLGDFQARRSNIRVRLRRRHARRIPTR